MTCNMHHSSHLRMRRGYGSIRYLGKGRRNAYAVHPPSKPIYLNGKKRYFRPKAICYVPDWYTGFAVLTAWHAGKYYPGLEALIRSETKSFSNADYDDHEKYAGNADFVNCPYFDNSAVQTKPTDRVNPVDRANLTDRGNLIDIADPADITDQADHVNPIDIANHTNLTNKFDHTNPANHSRYEKVFPSLSDKSGWEAYCSRLQEYVTHIEKTAGKYAAHSGSPCPPKPMPVYNHEYHTVPNSSYSADFKAANINRQNPSFSTDSKQVYLISPGASFSEDVHGQYAFQSKPAIFTEPDPDYQTGYSEKPTLIEVFNKFYENKFGDCAARKLSASAALSTKSIAQKLVSIYDRRLDDLSVDDLQSLVNSIRQGKSTVSKTVILIKELYKYALPREMCSKNPAQYIRMPDTKDYQHHQDFTDEELKILWKHKNDPLIQMVLIMCYSGFRISAYKSIETNLSERYFRGGIKTESGKNRIVPIHHGILPLVREILSSDRHYLSGISIDRFCKKMSAKMRDIGIDINGRHHTPHSCRHTFSRLCESYNVNEADRKRMLGHSFGSDLTNGVYGHRTLEELRAEIEKIQIPDDRPRNIPL